MMELPVVFAVAHFQSPKLLLRALSFYTHGIIAK